MAVAAEDDECCGDEEEAVEEEEDDAGEMNHRVLEASVASGRKWAVLHRKWTSWWIHPNEMRVASAAAAPSDAAPRRSCLRRCCRHH